jgi:glycosyltransferase involved in cell wall biosynthesis
MARILILTEQYLPRITGTVTHVEHLSRALATRGHDVILAVPYKNEEVTEEIQISDISFGRKLIRVPVKRTNSETSDRDERENYIAVCKEKMSEWITGFRPDLIHVMFGHYLHAALKGAVKTPKIWTCHNVPPQEYIMPANEKSYFGRVINRLYCSLVRFKHRRMILSYPYDKVIAVSDATAHILWKDIGLFSEKIVVVPNGIRNIETFASAEKLPESDRPIQLLTVGGMKRHKGIHHLPRVAHNLREAGLNFTWRLVGHISNSNYVEAIKKELLLFGVSNRVIWMGEIDESQLDKEYQNSHFYVHMATQEGFCLTVLEALATGVPVVGTRVGAIPEMIQYGSGIVVEPNAESIGAGIIKALNDYTCFRKGKDLGKAIQDRYGWDAVALRTEEVYDSCVKRVFNAI